MADVNNQGPLFLSLLHWCIDYEACVQFSYYHTILYYSRTPTPRFLALVIYTPFNAYSNL